MISPGKDEGTGIRNALRLVGLVGLIVSANILTGTWAGIKLDNYMGTRGVLTALGVLLGVFAGLGLAAWLLIRETRDQSPPRP